MGQAYRTELHLGLMCDLKGPFKLLQPFKGSRRREKENISFTCKIPQMTVVPDLQWF